jgi:hypothetical protein
MPLACLSLRRFVEFVDYGAGISVIFGGRYDAVVPEPDKERLVWPSREK